MAYGYCTNDDVKTNQLAIVVAAALMVSGSWHIVQSRARDSVRYVSWSAQGEGDPDCARPAVLAAETL